MVPNLTKSHKISQKLYVRASKTLRWAILLGVGGACLKFLFSIFGMEAFAFPSQPAE